MQERLGRGPGSADGGGWLVPQVDRLGRAKGPLDLAERLAASHRVGSAHLLLGEAGPEDVVAIERRLGRDRVIAEGIAEAIVFNDELEVLGNHVLVDQATDPDAPTSARIWALFRTVTSIGSTQHS